MGCFSFKEMYFSTKPIFLRFIYNILTLIVLPILWLVAIFNPKIKVFVAGRRQTFPRLEENIKPSDKTIWMHVASLGEYEQGLPVLEGLKEAYPNYKLILSFFSPSGYEVKKNSTPADIVVYLPLDTSSNAKRFLELTHPSLALFIKYEVWPNYLKNLKDLGTPTLLLSALFSERQSYFKWYGSFLRDSLKAFSHFFVQDTGSKQLLDRIRFSNCTVSGDTRFDRVAQILEQDNRLDFMDSFTNNQACFVAGSTWPEDEALLVPFINTLKSPLKVVIAPHNIKKATIEKLKESFTKKAYCFSELTDAGVPEDAEVLIVDTIGLLTKIYSYASVAYVGGGFATGLHNTLEPAVFGIPILIGPQYSNFKEAEDLVNAGGIRTIASPEAFAKTMDELLTSKSLQQKLGTINGHYVKNKQGATAVIFDHINGLL